MTKYPVTPFEEYEPIFMRYMDGREHQGQEFEDLPDIEKLAQLHVLLLDMLKSVRNVARDFENADEFERLEGAHSFFQSFPQFQQDVLERSGMTPSEAMQMALLYEMTGT